MNISVIFANRLLTNKITTMKTSILFSLMTLLTLAAFLSCSNGTEFPSEIEYQGNTTRSSTSNQSKYYYFRGQKIPITTNDSLCYVVYEEKASLQNNSINQKKSTYGKIVPTKEVLSQNSSLKNNIDNKIVAIENVIGDSIPVLNECYVKLRNEEELETLIKIANEHKCKVTPPSEYSAHWAIVHTSIESDMQSIELSNFLFETGKFEDTDPGISLGIQECFTPSDPYYTSNQWNLKNSNDGISMPNAWNHTKGTSSVKVAIFDSNAVNDGLSDLSGQFTGDSYDCACGSSPSIYRNITNPNHATEVASIIAAKHNGIGIAGIAPNCKFVSYSIYSASPLQLAIGLNRANADGVSVFNFSFKTTPSSIISSAIDNLLQNGRNGKGAIVCIAAGNNGIIEYPANAHPNAIVVGATNSNAHLSSFSGQGNGLDIVAPGENVSVTSGNTGITQKSGTSYACPHVSGVAALMLAVNPNLTALEVEDILKHSATPVYPYTSYPNSSVGWGLLNANNALKIASGDYEIRTEYSDDTTIGYPRTRFSLSDVPAHCTISWHSATGAFENFWNQSPEYAYSFNGQRISETIQADLAAGAYTLHLSKTLFIYNIPKIRNIVRFSTDLEESTGRVDLKAIIALPNANLSWSIGNNPNVSLIDFPYEGDAGYNDAYEGYQSIVFHATGNYSIPITVTASNAYGYDIKTYQLEYYCHSPSILSLAVDQ